MTSRPLTAREVILLRNGSRVPGMAGLESATDECRKHAADMVCCPKCEPVWHRVISSDFADYR